MATPIVEAPVPEPERTTVYVVSPRVGEPERFTSLSPRVIGVWTHWMGGTTHPCLRPGGVCPGCGEKASRRWKGCLWGWSYAHRRDALLELPADTVRLTVQLRDSAVDLRGATLTCRRVGPHSNSVVTCEVKLGDQRDQRSTEPPDVLAALMRRWGLGEYDPPTQNAAGEGGVA